MPGLKPYILYHKSDLSLLFHQEVYHLAFLCGLGIYYMIFFYRATYHQYFSVRKMIYAGAEEAQETEDCEILISQEPAIQSEV